MGGAVARGLMSVIRELVWGIESVPRLRAGLVQGLKDDDSMSNDADGVAELFHILESAPLVWCRPGYIHSVDDRLDKAHTPWWQPQQFSLHALTPHGFMAFERPVFVGHASRPWLCGFYWLMFKSGVFVMPASLLQAWGSNPPGMRLMMMQQFPAVKTGLAEIGVNVECDLGDDQTRVGAFCVAWLATAFALRDDFKRCLSRIFDTMTGAEQPDNVLLPANRQCLVLDMAGDAG